MWSYHRYGFRTRIERATANFALTVRPVYTKEAYLPENQEILQKLKSAYTRKGLHVTITATFADAERPLYDISEDLIRCKDLVFYPKCLGNQRGSDVKTLQLVTQHETFNTITSRLRRSTLRGGERAEVRMGRFFPVESTHIRFMDKETAYLSYEYVDHFVPISVHLKQYWNILFELFFY
jgi:hypothetical protein